MLRAEELIPRMRSALRAALPERAFIRRDRGESLFISNAPVFQAEIAPIEGFLLETEGGMLRILPDAAWIFKLEEAYASAPDFFCASLMRFAKETPDREGLRLFAAGAKILDGGVSATGEEKSAFERALRQRAAVALRGGCRGGGLYAAGILNYKIKNL